VCVKLSVIIPVYNEVDHIEQVLHAVREVNISKEIIVVDDCSKDGTTRILRNYANIKTLFHPKNKGKGAAIRSGLAVTSGDYVIIQDADLEYSPEQYQFLLKPLDNRQTRAVYGSRILGRGTFIPSSYYANRFLTLLTNILYDSRLTDIETCYKVIDTSLIKSLQLTSSRFEIEPEITCKLLKRKEKIVELPITYQGRRKGKKIGAKDGIQAIWNIMKWKFRR
jgi:glycosyltransferase involved in cell wall biosynthesis